jgi:hypothetical protein
MTHLACAQRRHFDAPDNSDPPGGGRVGHRGSNHRVGHRGSWGGGGHLDGRGDCPGTIAGLLRGCARSYESILLEERLARRRDLRPAGKERLASSVTHAGVDERARTSP